MFYERILLNKAKTISHLFRKIPCVLCGRTFSTSFYESKCRLIQELTGCTQKMVRNHAIANLDLLLLSEDDIRARVENLKRCNVEDYRGNSRVLPLLHIHPTTVRNRTMYLREAGFEQSSITVSNIRRKLVGQLKKEGKIPQDTNVLESLLKYVELDKKFYPKPMADEQFTLFDVRVSVLIHWLKHTVKVGDEVLKKVDVPGSDCLRMTLKALTYLQGNYNMARNTLGMSEDKISRNYFILNVNGENVQRMLTEIDEVSGRNIVEVLKNNPRIMSCTVDNVKNVIKKVEGSGLSKKTLWRCPSLLTFNSENIDKKIEKMKNNEYMTACFSNPLVGAILHTHKRFANRVKILEDANVNYGPIYSMVSKPQFIEYIKNSCANTGNDVLYFLVHHLSTERSEVKKKLARNRYWMYVPILSIKKSLEYLRKQFTDEEIIENMTVLLYPSERLEKELDNINYKEGLESCKSNGKIRQDLRLPLLLYVLEKETNFTDESIWYGSESGLDFPVSYETLLELAAAS